MKHLFVYRDKNGREPYTDWFRGLSIEYKCKIASYLERVALGGSKKNIQFLGDGVFEIKINYGPGFRIYFGQIDFNSILLLLGGDKKSQRFDIKKAKNYWSKYEKI